MNDTPNPVHIVHVYMYVHVQMYIHVAVRSLGSCGSLIFSCIYMYIQCDNILLKCTNTRTHMHMHTHTCTHMRTHAPAPPPHTQNDVSLGEEASLEQLWDSGMEAYRNNNWQTVVDRLEEAIQVFNGYQNRTLLCLKQCHRDGELGQLKTGRKRETFLPLCSFSGSPQLSEKDLETVAKYAGDDRIIRQFLVYAARSKCVRECKAQQLSASRRYPDPTVLQRFRIREIYSFLHYAYYQVSKRERKHVCIYMYVHCICMRVRGKVNIACLCSWITMRKVPSVSLLSCSTTRTVIWCLAIVRSTARLSG